MGVELAGTQAFRAVAASFVDSLETDEDVQTHKITGCKTKRNKRMSSEVPQPRLPTDDITPAQGYERSEGSVEEERVNEKCCVQEDSREPECRLYAKNCRQNDTAADDSREGSEVFNVRNERL